MFSDSVKNWERLFIRAKIRANPSDYRLTNRLIFVSDVSEYEKYNIFQKTDEGEVALASACDLAWTDEAYFTPNRAKYDYTLTDIRERLDKEKESLNCYETVSIINWNNILGYETALNKLETTLSKEFKDEKTISEYFTLQFKLFNESSLCSNLMYLLDSSFDKYTLAELDDLAKAREFIKDKKAPLIHLVQYNETKMDPACYLAHPIIPWDPNPGILNLAKSQYMQPIFHDAGKIGLTLVTIYLCEILYYLNETPNKYLKRLFLEGFNNDSFISNYFYNIDPATLELSINKNLLVLFTKDNVKRFDNFKTYILKVLSAEDNFNDWRIPRCYVPAIVMDLVRNCYAEAMKVNRVKHIQLIYSIYKSTHTKELDIDDDNETSLLNNDGIGGTPGSPDSPDNSLFNLDDLTDIPQDTTTTSEDTTSRRKEFGAKLHSIDEITEDALGKSMYTYDITDVEINDGSKNGYDNVAKKVDMIKKTLIRAIREIKTYNSGGKLSGLSSGKLDIKNIHKYKQTKDIFCANRYKIKEMDLAFGIVLDGSGSMSGSKIEDGKITMILLHEVLLALRINHNIIMHNSRRDLQSNIYKYYYFNEEKRHSVNKPYNLAGIHAGGGNCDSGALYYEEQLLNHVRNKDKICIIFSDGEPTECTGSQLTEQVRHMEKNGIHVIGVGVDFPGVNEYYPDHANGRSLKEMVDIVVKILNRYVLEKKD